MKEAYKPNISGILRVYSGKKCYTYKNLVTNEVTKFFTGMINRDSDYKFSHIYGQWGEEGDFPPGTGPFFSVDKTDTVADLDTITIHTDFAHSPIIVKSISTQENQSEYTDNIISNISFMTQNNNKVYVGAGLVCELPGENLLLAHVALDGIKKLPEYDLVFVWDWVFTN